MSRKFCVIQIIIFKENQLILWDLRRHSKYILDMVYIYRYFYFIILLHLHYTDVCINFFCILHNIYLIVHALIKKGKMPLRLGQTNPKGLLHWSGSNMLWNWLRCESFEFVYVTIYALLCKCAIVNMEDNPNGRWP